MIRETFIDLWSEWKKLKIFDVFATCFLIFFLWSDAVRSQEIVVQVKVRTVKCVVKNIKQFEPIIDRDGYVLVSPDRCNVAIEGSGEVKGMEIDKNTRTLEASEEEPLLALGLKDLNCLRKISGILDDVEPETIIGVDLQRCQMVVLQNE